MKQLDLCDRPISPKAASPPTPIGGVKPKMIDLSLLMSGDREGQLYVRTPEAWVPCVAFYQTVPTCLRAEETKGLRQPGTPPPPEFTQAVGLSVRLENGAALEIDVLDSLRVVWPTVKDAKV